MSSAKRYSLITIVGVIIFLIVPLLSRYELHPDHIYNNIENKNVSSFELQNKKNSLKLITNSTENFANDGILNTSKKDQITTPVEEFTFMQPSKKYIY